MKHVVVNFKDGSARLFVVPDEFDVSVVEAIAPDPVLELVVNMLEVAPMVAMREHEVLKQLHLDGVAQRKRKSG